MAILLKSHMYLDDALHEVFLGYGITTLDHLLQYSGQDILNTTHKT